MKMKEIVKAGSSILIFALITALFWFISYFIIHYCANYLPILQNFIVSQSITLWLMFLLAGGSFYLFYYKYFALNKSIWMSVSQSLKSMSNGDFSTNVELAKEIQEKDQPLAELVTEINNLAEQLSIMEKLKQEFISNVSHEIQTPLTSIKGFTHLLKNNNATLEQRLHYIKVIEAETNRLSKISENLLKLTALEGQTEPIIKKEFRLDYQIRRIILLCEPLWLEKNIEIRLFDKPITIFGDEDLLEQVWVNLLHNAIKFTDSKGIITIQMDHLNEKTIQIIISDTGVGMNKEQQSRIFERFYKVDKARQSSGSGLGLSIVKKIIDLQKGAITVKSEPSVGTTFTVTLPKS